MPVLSAASLSFGATAEALILTQTSEKTVTGELTEAKNASGEVTGVAAHGKNITVTIEGMTLGAITTLEALPGTVDLYTPADTDLPKIVVNEVKASKSNADFRKVSISGKHFPSIASMA